MPHPTITPRQVCILFGSLCDSVGWSDDAIAREVKVSPGTISKWRSLENDTQPSPTAIAALSHQAGNYQLLDLLNEAAGRSDDATAMRKTLASIGDQIGEALGNG